MPDNNTDSTEKHLWQPPPFGKPFIGRARELAELDRFLSDTSAESKPIMLVYGQRGIGKSALVREVAQRALERDTFKTVAWLDRTRAVELFDEESYDLLTTQPGTPDLGRFTEDNQQRFMHRFMSKRQESGDLPIEAMEFLKEALKLQPYLLVIDDFDEYDNLGDSRTLCARLARVQSPNKVVLTTRWLRHKFAQPVWDYLEVGLLVGDDVRQLVNRSNLSKLDPDRLVEGDLNATAEYIWRESAGLPEFITRFLIPIQEQTKWRMKVDPRWQDKFRRFSAGYLARREQEHLPEEYTEEYSDKVRECDAKFRKLGLVAGPQDNVVPEERYVLLSLVQEQEAAALEITDLARRLGLRPEDETDWRQLDDALDHLHKERLIGRRCETRVDKSKDQDSVRRSIVWEWVLLPFTADLLRKQLLTDSEVEKDFRQEQADHWIRFVEGYAAEPKRIEEQLERIHRTFLWCFNQGEWARLVRLGRPISGLLIAPKHTGTEHPARATRLIEICEKTAEAALRLDCADLQMVADLWLLLAQFYIRVSAENWPEAQRLSYEYAHKAIHLLEKAEETDGDYRARWAHGAFLMAQTCFVNADVAQTYRWLEEAEKAGQVVSDEWIALACFCIKISLGADDRERATFWLQKLIAMDQVLNNLDVASELMCDLASLHLNWEQYDQAYLLARQVIDMLTGGRDGNIAGESQVRARVIAAQIASHKGRTDECIAFLGEARELAKSAKLHPIAEELKRWLDYIRLRTASFDPVSSIDRLLGARLLWGIVEDGDKCPVCKQEFGMEDLLGGQVWRCPNCSTFIHASCLTATNDRCPICQTQRAS